MHSSLTVTVARSLVLLVPLLAASRASAANMTLSSPGFVLHGNPAWRIDAVGDFNGDGHTDILWRLANDSGPAEIWLMNGSRGVNGDGTLKAKVGLNIGPDFRVVGVGDFDGDGQSDLLLRRKDDTGPLLVWRMNERLENGQLPPNYALFGYEKALAVPSDMASGWSVAGVGDFNDDGVSDILWYQASTGGLRVWLVTSEQGAPDPTPYLLRDWPFGRTGWTIAGIGDLNGDGHADIVIRNPSTGALGVFFITITGPDNSPLGASTTYYDLLSPAQAAPVVSVADADADGKADLLMLPSATASNVMIARFPSDGHTVGAFNYASTGSYVTGLHVGDFDSDRIDLFWRLSNGDVWVDWLERKFSSVTLKRAFYPSAQEKSNWCWAAAGESIMRYASNWASYPTQCQEATYHSPFTGPNGSTLLFPDGSPLLARISDLGGNCCTGATGAQATAKANYFCNTGSFPEYFYWGFASRQKANDLPLTLKELVNEIRQDRPVSFGWGWDGTDSGHAMVATGVTYRNGEPWVSISDPQGYLVEVAFSAFGAGPTGPNPAYVLAPGITFPDKSHHHHGTQYHIRRRP